MKYFKFIVFLIISAFVFSSVAFYNGYPLLASDSFGYINQGFGNFVGQFRLFIYGAFVRNASLTESLWFVVFFQGLILTYVMYKFMKTFLSSLPNYLYIIGVFILLTAFTGVSWYCSQIMTDIFTGIAALSMLILLFNKDLPRREQILLFVIFLFSIQTHKSHYMVFTVFALAIGVISWSKGWFTKNTVSAKHFLILLALVGFNWLLTPLINYAVEGDYGMESKSHIFLAGRLIETGMLERVLDEECPKKDYFLCEYKDQLPFSKKKFLWSNDSPLSQTGGWDAHEEGYKEIIRKSFTKPKFLLVHVYDFVQATVRQLVRTDVGKLIVKQTRGDKRVSTIDNRFHYEYPAFATSLQNQNKLNFENINNRRFYILVLSVIVGLYLFSRYYSKMDQKTVVLTIFILLFIIVNAAFAGPLAGVSTRYQGRIIWMLPLLAFVLVYNTWKFLSIKKCL